MRNLFEKQLEQLNIELIKMGALCEEAISNASKSLLYQDELLRQKVFETDAQIDRKERDIERLCIKLLLHQQPVAGDLRAIASALKMISDMERIGDQAADISEILGYVKEHYLARNSRIGEMATATIKMVTDSIDSFVKKDLDMAKAVIQYDDIVDDLFDKIKRELIDLIRSEPENGELFLDLLMIAKYFERIGDHATNIAEWVQFSITGEHVSDEMVNYI
jgi:phosphate transport system protein